MKTRYAILSAASIIPLLSSCASQQSVADNQLWKIKPAYSVTHSSDTPESYYQLGRYYQGQNRHDQALAAYRKALEMAPSYVQARNGIGVIYALQGRKQEAIEQFRLALKEAPGTVNIQNNLGYALYLNGSYGEAVKVLEQAVAQNPDNRQAQTNLAMAVDKAGLSQVASTTVADAGQPVADVPNPGGTQAAAASLGAPAIAVNDMETGSGLGLPLAQNEIKPESQLLPAAQGEPEKVAQPAASETKPWAAPSVSAPFKVEVANGNGVRGMARKVSGYLGQEGYASVRLTNQKPFTVASSQVQYREGYQAQAQHLASTLPGQPTVAASGSLRVDIGVRVLLGKDIANNVAYFEPGRAKVRLASKDSNN